MTPLISSAIATAAKIVSPDATTDIASAGVSSFENILSSSMQGHGKSQATSPEVQTKVESTPAVGTNSTNSVKSVSNSSNISDLLQALTQSNQVAPAAQNEVESLKQLITKDLSNQNNQTKELTTKEPLNKDLLITSKSQPILLNDVSSKNTIDPTLPNVFNPIEIKTEKDLQAADPSNVTSAQMMLASMLQQSVPQTSNNQEVQTASDETLLPAKSLNSSLNKQSSDQMSSFQKDALNKIENQNSQDVSVKNADLTLDPAQIQARLSETKNQEITKQLSQLQSKYDLGNSGANRENSGAFVSPITPNVVNQVSDSTSSENNFSFLAKDQSSTITNGLENASLVNNSSTGMQFAEHLTQKNHEVSANQGSTASENHIQTPFQSPDWGPALNQRVTWMIKDQLQNATITINPPHLGQIEVKLQTDQAQQTSVHFMSNSPEVRQAITDHLGTLREMMSQSGLQLGQADVGARNQSSSEQYGSTANKKGGRQDFSLPEITSTESSQGIGLINTYA